VTILLLILTFIVPASSATPSQVQKIGRIDDVRAILFASQMVVIDIDSTLIKSATQFGSDMWYDAGVQNLIDSGFSPERAKADLIGVVKAAEKAMSYRLVEPGLVKKIADLKASGIPVIALTKRDFSERDVTLQTLKKLGIKLSQPEEMAHSNLPFSGGVLFAGDQEKGPVLLSALETLENRPQTISFLDDQKSNVDSVMNSMQASGVETNGIYYRAIDRKKAYRADIADLQLTTFFASGVVPSDSDAEKILIARAVVRRAVQRPLPTAQELFITGKFNVKPPLPFSENHFGEELDLSMRRPVANLAGTVFEAKYGKPGYTLVANFYHRGRLHIARVPNEGVEKVFLQRWYFQPEIMGHYIADHTLLRFQMNPEHPVEIVADMPDASLLAKWSAMSSPELFLALPREKAGEENRVRNVVLSGEVQWVANDAKKEYDLIRGELGAFIMIQRFMSMQDRIEKFMTSGDPVDEIELTDIRANLSDVLTIGLASSEEAALKTLYLTGFIDCRSHVFGLIERAEKWSIGKPSIIPRIDGLVPSTIAGKLRFYGAEPAFPLYSDHGLALEMRGAYERVLAPEAAIWPMRIKIQKNVPRIMKLIRTMNDGLPGQKQVPPSPPAAILSSCAAAIHG
jgi:hypothetical protein